MEPDQVGPAGPVIRVALLDNDKYYLEALCGYLETEPDLQVVGTASTPEAFLQLVQATTPDVAMIDLYIPPHGEAAGFAVLEQIQRHTPQVQCLIVTQWDRPEYLVQAFARGARGYAMKPRPDSHQMPLEDIIRGVARGARYVDPELSLPMLLGAPEHAPGSPAGPAPAAPPFTRREQEVLHWMSQGLRPEQIASKLTIGLRTVRTYQSSMEHKLGLTNLAQLEWYAAAHPAHPPAPGARRP